jgi:5'-3' exonuclease
MTGWNTFVQDQADNVEDLKLKLKNVLREKADLTSGGKELEDAVWTCLPRFSEQLEALRCNDRLHIALSTNFGTHYGCLNRQVRLGEPGWKERYYMEKFEAKSPEEIEEIRKDVVGWLETVSSYLASTVQVALSLSLQPTFGGLNSLA